MMERLIYLNKSEREFLKELGDDPITDSYKDWRNKENELNNIYRYILEGGVTFCHKTARKEALLHPCTKQIDKLQFTIFDENGPVGDFSESCEKSISRKILDYEYTPTRQTKILS